MNLLLLAIFFKKFGYGLAGKFLNPIQSGFHALWPENLWHGTRQRQRVIHFFNFSLAYVSVISGVDFSRNVPGIS